MNNIKVKNFFKEQNTKISDELDNKIKSKEIQEEIKQLPKNIQEDFNTFMNMIQNSNESIEDIKNLQLKLVEDILKEKNIPNSQIISLLDEYIQERNNIIFNEKINKKLDKNKNMDLFKFFKKVIKPIEDNEQTPKKNVKILEIFFNQLKDSNEETKHYFLEQLNSQPELTKIISSNLI